jgi:PAS domain S-box-containing protein
MDDTAHRTSPPTTSHTVVGGRLSAARIRSYDTQLPATSALEQTFGLAFDSASIGMAIVGLDGTFLRVNRGLCDLVGYSPQELTSMTFHQITHPDDVSQDVANRDALICGTIPSIRREKRYVHKDGGIVWILLDVALQVDDYGGPMFFVSQMTEITGLKRAEDELRKQAAELATLHDTTLALLDRQHTDDVLVRIVRSAAELTDTVHGYVYLIDEDSLVVRVGIGLFAGSLGYRLEKGEGVAGRAWELGRAVRADDYRSMPRARDEWAYLRAVLAVPMQIRGEVIGVIGLAHPADEPGVFTKDHEQQLSRFAQLAAMVVENARYANELEELNRDLRAADEIKDQFVAMASHELRTPLTNVMGFTKTLLDRWDEIGDDERRTYVETIDRNSERLNDLVADLLMTSRIESGSLEIDPARTNVRAAIVSALTSVPGAASATVVCDERLDVFADRLRVEQILVNYIANAVKHGDPPFCIEARRSSGSIVITVSDEGPGVPEAFRARLFQRFAQADGGLTRRTQGTGLGLSIVRALARAMGGDAWFEPNAPTGSRFGVRLPMP